MKNLSLLLLLLSFCFFSCSPSDDAEDAETETEDPNIPEFAMTAKVNDDVFQANNPFGKNEFSTNTIWNYYPPEEFIVLQGRQGGGFGGMEINIWLKKSEIAVGTYEIGEEAFEVKPSHYVSLTYPSNFASEYTKEGTIVITNVNSSTKIVQGTFEFTTIPELEDPSIPVNFTVTEGKFRYTYE